MRFYNFLSNMNGLSSNTFVTVIFIHINIFNPSYISTAIPDMQKSYNKLFVFNQIQFMGGFQPVS